MATVTPKITLTSTDLLTDSISFSVSSTLTVADYLYVYDDTSTGDPVMLKLAGGDWAWMPTIADKTYRVYATTTGTICEYGIFGQDQ